MREKFRSHKIKKMEGRKSHWKSQSGQKKSQKLNKKDSSTSPELHSRDESVKDLKINVFYSHNGEKSCWPCRRKMDKKSKMTLTISILKRFKNP